MEEAIKNIKEIKVHGRTTANRDPLTLFWSASGFECNVSGSELWVEVEVNYHVYEPWFSYTINGDWIGRQMLQKGRYWIPLFRGMNAEKIKNVRFFKDLQAMGGEGDSFVQIHALRFDGTFFPVEEKSLKIEFIGDSITSGEGLFGAKSEEDWIPMFFSALKSYTYMTSKAVNADYRIFSQSGWGTGCGWDNNPHSALPLYYEEICSLMTGAEAEKLGAKEKYDFSTWQPDYVVVNLGTNDASAFQQQEWVDEKTGEKFKLHTNEDGSFDKESAAYFEKAVIGFLQKVRKNNPNAHIIWCYGMLGMNIEPLILEAVSEYKRISSDDNVKYVQLPDTTEETVGSRWHPGYLSHKNAAAVLADYINGRENIARN